MDEARGEEGAGEKGREEVEERKTSQLRVPVLIFASVAAEIPAGYVKDGENPWGGMLKLRRTTRPVEAHLGMRLDRETRFHFHCDL